MLIIDLQATIQGKNERNPGKKIVYKYSPIRQIEK
jgi:hypothetical protein